MKRPPISDERVREYVLHQDDHIRSLEYQIEELKGHNKSFEERFSDFIEDLGFVKK